MKLRIQQASAYIQTISLRTKVHNFRATAKDVQEK